MTSALLTGMILGLFAGLAPGPYTTMLAATALERGFRSAMPLALAPLVTDAVPLLATTFLLTSLSPRTVSILGVVGGTVLIAIGLRLAARYRGSPRDRPDSEEGGRPTVGLGQLVTGTLVSPAPWLFWLGIGSPLLVRHLRVDAWHGVAFVTAIFVTNIGSASALAWAASRGRRVLAPFWRHRVLRLMGLALILAGIFLIWQGASGEPMQLEPDLIPDFVGPSDTVP